MSDIEVVIPWRGGCAHRERALADVVAQLPVPWRLAPCRPDGPWIKALAVVPTLERSEAAIVIVHDADVSCDGIPEAVQAVEDGAPWALPHLRVHRLTEHGLPERRPYDGIKGGGIVVARRETLLEIPLDPRFVGWGQEDHSWGLALRVLAGAPWRGTADLVHHWHPPQERLCRKRGSEAGWRLFRRYWRARANPKDMRRIVEEARAALEPHQSALRDRPALGVG